MNLLKINVYLFWDSKVRFGTTWQWNCYFLVSTRREKQQKRFISIFNTIRPHPTLAEKYIRHLSYNAPTSCNVYWVTEKMLWARKLWRNCWAGSEDEAGGGMCPSGGRGAEAPSPAPVTPMTLPCHHLHVSFVTFWFTHLIWGVKNSSNTTE